jgi:predicted Zn-dependent peptidase
MMAVAQGGAVQRTTLSNGLRVVTARRTETPLAAVKLFFSVGSRHDGAHPGLAHFVEHMLLSNAGSPAAKTVYDAVEGLGGELNAVTTREYTALQAVVLAPQLARIVNLFADLLEPSPIDAVAFERERAVIRQELRLQNDSSQIIWDVFLQTLWDGHPLAQPILGTLETVETMPPEAVGAHTRYYRAGGRIVLAAAGNVDHDALVRAAAVRFGGLPPEVPMTAPPERPARRSNGFVERETSQTHVVFGVEGVGLSDPRRSSLRLIEIVLGRGASSRLHRALRSDRGFVYAVSVAAMSYADRGYFAVYTASAPEHLPAVQGIVIDELDRLRRDGISEAELARAKVIYEAALARDFETALSVASILGIEELLYRLEPFADSVARINAVDLAQVRRVAGELLIPERATVAAVGRCWPDVRVLTR